MIRNLLLSTGALAILRAADSPSGLVVNDGLLPRFTAAGRYVEPGEVFDASELNTEEFVAKTAPVGTLTDEQLLAVVAQRGLTPNPGAPIGEPGAAPVAPATSQAALDALDKERAEQMEDAANVQRASEVIADQKAEREAADPDAAAAKARADADAARERSNANLDLDGDLKPGGSMNKADIAAELTDRKVEFDPAAKRDELAAKLLEARKADPKA